MPLLRLFTSCPLRFMLNPVGGGAVLLWINYGAIEAPGLDTDGFLKTSQRVYYPTICNCSDAEATFNIAVPLLEIVTVDSCRVPPGSSPPGYCTARSPRVNPERQGRVTTVIIPARQCLNFLEVYWKWEFGVVHPLCYNDDQCPKVVLPGTLNGETVPTGARSPVPPECQPTGPGGGGGGGE